MPSPSSVLTRVPPRVEVSEASDGRITLVSPLRLAPFARCLGDHLTHWAKVAPTRIFLAERSGEGWRSISYAETLDAVRSLGQALLDRGASATRPLLLLSENGLDHALLQLAAMHVGVPAAPLSAAYSLISRDFGKLRDCARTLGPSILYASDGDAYRAALDALSEIGLGALPLFCSRNPPRGRASTTIDHAMRTQATHDVDDAFAAVGHDTVAKVLFSSGSTGTPKGIVNTQRMLCSNQQAITQLWPFLDDRPPVVVDWLPWSHTFGGNHNFNMVLAHGGTLYVDDGRPTPALAARTVQNLASVSPTSMFNVPRGFDAVAALLETDDEARERVFAELDVIFYAAASLPASTWRRLEALAQTTRRGAVPMTSAWGLTETSPLVTSVHFPIDRPGVIGLPPPGVELALVPVGEKLELRVRGPNVTPGYWRTGGDLEAIDTDAFGFFATGDAGRLDDSQHPERGVVFDGRIAENFKLTSGTWVSVGALRIGVIAACDPWVQDAVVTGHDRDTLGLLLFAGVAASTIPLDTLHTHLHAALAAWNRTASSSTRIGRALVLDTPASIDAGEITDKGYVNQRAVLTRRSAAVERLYTGGEDVIVIAER